MQQQNDEDDLRPEYDLSSLGNLTRGKYYDAYRQQFRTVRLAEDLAEAFDSDEAVNQALRIYLREHPAEGATS